jgi:hypothetical protein
MSNEVAVIDGHAIPAHIMARMGQTSALTTSLAGGLGGGEALPRISIKGSRFRIVENGEETVLPVTHLDVVVVGANPRLSKQYYAKAWDPDDVGAPTCKSIGGIAPDDDSEEKQNDLCATCPHNAWGSKTGPQGQKLKACADLKRLAVVSPEDLDGPIYLLQVTPAAIKGLNAYQKGLSSRGIAPEVVKTRITFDIETSFPKLVFGLGGFLEEDEIAKVDDIIAGHQVKIVTGEPDPTLIQTTAVVTQAKPNLVKPAPAATTAPKAVAKPSPVVAKPVAQPVQEVEDVVEEAPAEPAAPKRGFGKMATPVPQQAAVAPKAAALKAKPKPANVAVAPAEPAAGGLSLADEIAGMIDVDGADDA